MIISVSDEIEEWKRLKGLTNIKSVIDKIEKHIIDLKCIKTSIGTNSSVTNNGVFKPSKQLKTIKEFSWEQESSKIKIRIKFENISSHNKSNIKLDSDSTSVSLFINDFKSAGADSDYKFSIPKLYSKIIPDKSTFYIKTNYVVLSLEKESPGHWPTIEYKNSNLTKPMATNSDKNSDPNSMLIDLMKNLYQEGDDEMKRTIAKAWTEANEKRSIK